jgi:cytochrome b561
MRLPGPFLLALALATAVPGSTRADVGLLGARLDPPRFDRPALSLYVVAAAPTGDPAKAPAEKPPAAKPPPKGDDMSFDLLGEAKPPQEQVDVGALRLRRTMLQWHQGIGFVLLGLDVATTVVGQLNYNDKFGGPNTNQYKATHQVLAYTTFGVFLIQGALALFAPNPIKAEHKGFDRVDLHKVSMAVATLGMLAQIGLGIYTVQREGYLNQEQMGTIHLAIGYVTLAAICTGVGALVF